MRIAKTMSNKNSKVLRKANVNRDMIDRLALVAKERRSRSKVSDHNIVDLTNESSQEEAASPPPVKRKLISRTTLPSYLLRFIKDTSKPENRQRLIEKAESVLDLLKRKVLDAPPEAKKASIPVQEIKTKTEQRIQCTACTWWCSSARIHVSLWRSLEAV